MDMDLALYLSGVATGLVLPIVFLAAGVFKRADPPWFGNDDGMSVALEILNEYRRARTKFRRMASSHEG